ncbi:MAG TPA: nuclear transport factor 2 family protein [Candidatus Limnocylindria bacterium]|nr:nuclear transport factor 2 family protein [Candidatus Limnocylindria bacterium]
MDEHPNVTAVREWSKQIENGDLMAAADGLADDVVWYEIGRSEPTRGKEALRSRFSEMGDYEINPTTHDVVGNDEHVVQLVNVTARNTRTGQSLDYRTAEIYHMQDGKVTARWAFSDDTARILEFFAT